MSIEGAKQELEELAGKVDTLAQNEIDLTQDERFTSLPERLTEANELAERLDALLLSVENDAYQYFINTLAFYNNVEQGPGPRCAELASEASAILEGTGKSANVSAQIGMMGEPFIAIQDMGMGQSVLSMMSKAANYRSTIRRAGTFSTRMAGFFAEHNEAVPEAIIGQRDAVKASIQAIITGMDA